MGIRVDLSGAKEVGNLIARGKYHAVITDAEVRDTKNPDYEKNPTGQYVWWEFTIQDEPYQTWKQWTNTALGGSNLGFLKAVLAATGKFTDEELAGDVDFELEDASDPHYVIGSDVMITVRQKKRDKDADKDDLVNDVSKVSPYTGESSSLLP
jgi:hypothetical protein